jgi:hypothetical protein
MTKKGLHIVSSLGSVPWLAKPSKPEIHPELSQVAKLLGYSQISLRFLARLVGTPNSRGKCPWPAP